MKFNLKQKPQQTVPSSRRERPVVLKAENLVKVYKIKGVKTKVVKDVSFEVREGEIVGLLGSNGAGKTTSFRISCGLIPPEEGKVTLNGIDVTTWPMYRRIREGRLGYLPQDRSSFSSLTAEENLYAAMEFLGYTRSQMRAKCDELMNRFKLERVRHSKVGSGGDGGLSGGERRRLEIARALLTNPKILLLDEPFANVDPITVQELQAVVHELADDGVAILITDHQVDETLAITDRSYIIHEGVVLCSGTPLEVLSNQAAIRTYFGNKAEISREHFLKKQRLAGDEPASDYIPPEPEPEQTAGHEDLTPPPAPHKRPTLSLTRRQDEPVRQAHSPREEERESNRFDGKLGKLMRRK